MVMKVERCNINATHFLHVLQSTTSLLNAAPTSTTRHRIFFMVFHYHPCKNEYLPFLSHPPDSSSTLFNFYLLDHYGHYFPNCHIIYYLSCSLYITSIYEDTTC
ncbi:unnamed protein product [Vicia faba]|uniref:Uncharacterized protein n=1 Tax=Vicia faba TaxID=3906 RepID=A0AAV1BCI2_VICFA|nr:unnamed protein product [Vicia faba]